ncbi:AAA family ATPase [Rahnella aceris]
MVNKYLIGVAGTHSTGKSSFCRALHESLKRNDIRVSVVPSFGRLAVKLGIPLLKDHTYESTLWFINKTLEAKKIALDSSDVVIVERPEIDSFSYWKAAINCNKKDWPIEERNIIESIILNESKCYTHLFATNINNSIPLGPGRDTDIEFRNSVDFYLHQSLQTLSLKFTELRSDDHQNILIRLKKEILTSMETK